MKKDAYYFPHYSNARTDNKLLKLRRVLGIEGYGIYFMLLEVLRDQKDFKYPLDGLSELEFDFRVSKEKIATVIHDYDLFQVDESSSFFSLNQIAYLQSYIEKTDRARRAAELRWNNANAHTNAYAFADANASPNASANQNANADARRGEESKGDKREESITGVRTSPHFVKPKKEEISQYLIDEKNYDEFSAMAFADTFWNFYESKNWFVGKNKMSKWKAAIATWMKDGKNQPKNQPNPNRWLQ